ncbi:hypothetical protein [Amycolatopsis dendrobii]|uniref:Uncharacterized protein n=1 Tax=Amycolatopsis dendrobii TaxID=2760662 RepID=A0A7W3W4N3_9PSEU|nr:hypothetical protein [Amycolatopsis dendrobii]MBB1158751.1 hypothetical protein [Amycolatopsis dendrobii]
MNARSVRATAERGVAAATGGLATGSAQRRMQVAAANRELEQASCGGG